jgi:UDP-glucose 4-epimerase
MGLTVAVTGPTGDIGKPLLGALERNDAVERVVGMARRPFDPAAEGWSKVSYRQGDILDPEAVAGLVDGADVVVHLAFIIFGSHEETHRVNLEGTRNVFEQTVRAAVPRLIYTSSVAAYGFNRDNPQPLTEETEAKGSDEFYYSAQKAELEQLLRETLQGTPTEAYVFRPCVVAGPQATTVIEQTLGQVQIGLRLPGIKQAMDLLPFFRPVVPNNGVPFQLVHHDDVAEAIAAAIEGRGEAGVYNLAAPGEITASDLASALGWYSVPVPDLAVHLTAEVVSRVPFLSGEVEWITAVRTPVLMSTEKAERELDWTPLYDTVETLAQTAGAAREQQIVT